MSHIHAFTPRGAASAFTPPVLSRPSPVADPAASPCGGPRCTNPLATPPITRIAGATPARAAPDTSTRMAMGLAMALGRKEQMRQALYAVDQGVPLPAIDYSENMRTCRTMRPFADMQVGDSFAEADDGRTDARGDSISYQTLYRATRRWMQDREPTANFIIRHRVENGQRVLRCWKIA